MGEWGCTCSFAGYPPLLSDHAAVGLSLILNRVANYLIFKLLCLFIRLPIVGKWSTV